MRLAVTGKQGQVARALAEVGPALGADVVLLGRPAFDLTAPETVRTMLVATRPDAVVNAAAYTAVDQAEREPEQAMAVNAAGADALATTAVMLGVPLIQLSTDYVFDGCKTAPYVEEDPVGPSGVYGASKLAAERAVAAASSNYVILRTAWIYAPYGKNFVRTMLALAKTRNEVRVVADQQGCPTYAPDIAQGVIAVARNLLNRPDPQLRGTFHLASSEGTTWAEFAEAIFAFLAEHGLRRPVLTPITSAEYPTAARRPANSRLDCRKLARCHGVVLPSWRTSLKACLTTLAKDL